MLASKKIIGLAQRRLRRFIEGARRRQRAGEVQERRGPLLALALVFFLQANAWAVSWPPMRAVTK